MTQAESLGEGKATAEAQLENAQQSPRGRADIEAGDWQRHRHRTSTYESCKVAVPSKAMGAGWLPQQV